MRVRRFALWSLLPLASGALLLSACRGDDPEATGTPPPGGATSTAAPTATPLARVPDPVIVTGDGSSPGNGSSEGAATYLVEAGDSLGAIAARFGVDIEVIQEANDLDGVDIFIGQELIIPRGNSGSGGSGTTAPEATATSTPSSPGAGGTYTVEAGDTAFGIALQFDVTVADLAAANDMTEEEMTDLQIGQVIRIPSAQ